MSLTATADIAATVAALRSRFGLVPDPARRGPVPLGRFLDECNLLHVTLGTLTRAEIANHLRKEGIDPAGLDTGEDANQLLAGFLMTFGPDGYVFVAAVEPNQQDQADGRSKATPLGRRRFTAAHELGHFILHREQMGRWIADTPQTILDEQEPNQAEEMEKEADRFAAEILMPAHVCRARADEFRDAYRTCPRSLFAYHLAAELLVSPEAMRNRLRTLGVGDDR